MGADDVLFQRLGRVFPPGTVLFNDGEVGREMYIIQTGSVEISKEIRGVKKVLATLGDGEFFGEMSILNNEPRSATAEIVQESKVLVVDPKTFEAMIKGNAEIAVRMIMKLAQRLRDADAQIENLLLKDNNSRVVHALAQMAEKNGQQVDGGTRVIVTMAALANQSGLDAAQVKEVLDKLSSAKIILPDAEGVIIPDIQKMKKYLEFLAMKEQFGDM